jgi:hypothetical protein
MRAPRHLAFGDRAAMEEQLTADDMVALASICRAAGVPLDRWHRCKGIARPWEVLAAARLAEQIHEIEHATRTQALFDAAARLQLPADTIASRLKDWPRAAYAA